MNYIKKKKGLKSILLIEKRKKWSLANIFKMKEINKKKIKRH